MSQYARGEGRIELNSSILKEFHKLKECNEGDLQKSLQAFLPESSIEIASAIFVKEGKTIDVELFQSYNKYYSDEVENYLLKLAPYTRTGYMAFTNDEDSHWRFRFDETKETFVEENLVLYTESEINEKVKRAYLEGYAKGLTKTII